MSLTVLLALGTLFLFWVASFNPDMKVCAQSYYTIVIPCCFLKGNKGGVDLGEGEGGGGTGKGRGRRNEGQDALYEKRINKKRKKGMKEEG